MNDLKELLFGLASKLQEIADDTVDVNTSSELNELIDKVVESASRI